MSGRKFSLLSIRQDHLKRMNELRTLRKLEIDEMSLLDVQKFLESHGKHIMPESTEFKVT